MNYIYIGKIITTHGLKGEVKLRSNFEYKDKVFKKDFMFYIGSKKEPHKVLSYRKHMDYDMVVLEGINDIDQAIKYKQEKVYVLKEDIILDENTYLDEDLINLNVYYNNNFIGVITNIIDAGNNNMLMEINNNKYIPRNNNFILKVDLEKHIIYLKDVEGLI